MASEILGQLATAALLVANVGLVGCDEKETEASAPKAEPAVAALAAPTPPQVEAPAPATQEKTPTKNVEECVKGAPIEFSNPDVEAHVRMKTEKPEGEITASDLAKIKSLNFSRAQLYTLDTCMFVQMKNLKELFLGPGQVWDLSPLATLTNLETVRVGQNPVEDLAPLAAMTKMDRIDVSDTKIKDISVMGKMTKLTEVTLDGSLVEDIAALSAATELETLSIKRTQIKSLQPLKESKRLKEIFIAESYVADHLAETGVVHANGTKIMTE